MSGPADYRAAKISETPKRDAVFSLPTARLMLTLVERIVRDIVNSRQELARMVAERLQLDQQRRELAWPARARRYRLREEIADQEETLQRARAELDTLGVALLDSDRGLVGFPTLVNDCRAFFSWQPGEKGLLHWHFAEETTRRPIPATWAHSS